MMLRLSSILVFFTLCACTIGTSTTERPAINRPAIGPDGAFWDAATVARQDNVDAFLYALSPQFKHRALWPSEELPEITSQDEFDDQKAKIEAKLVEQQQTVLRMGLRYMEMVSALVEGKFIEVSKPRYDIDYTDEFDRAEGPNSATVTVSVYPKGDLPPDYEPEQLQVRFIMDGRRWLIDSLKPDSLKGAFAR